MKVALTPRPMDVSGLFGASTDVQSLWAVVGGRRYSVLVSRDPIEQRGALPDPRWHISVAGQSDVPRWRDLVVIGHEVRPGVVFVVGVPPQSWWMSIHPHCLHLWEVKDANLCEQWLSERMGVDPS